LFFAAAAGATTEAEVVVLVDRRAGGRSTDGEFECIPAPLVDFSNVVRRLKGVVLLCILSIFKALLWASSIENTS